MNPVELEQRLKFCEGQLYTLNTLVSQSQIHTEKINELIERIDKLTLDKESEEIDNSIEENIKELQKKKRKQKKKEWNNKTRLCEVCNIQVKNNGWGKHNKTKKHLRNKGAYLVNDSDTIDE